MIFNYNLVRVVSRVPPCAPVKEGGGRMFRHVVVVVWQPCVGALAFSSGRYRRHCRRIGVVGCNLAEQRVQLEAPGFVPRVGQGLTDLGLCVLDLSFLKQGNY